MKDLPETIEEKTVHSGFFDLRIDTIRKKNSEHIEFTVLATKVGAVSILATNPENRWIVTNEYRHSIRSFVLSLPGGRMEEGEDPIYSAQRELLEETGYQAKELKFLSEYYPMPSVCDQKISLFRSENCIKISEKKLDPYEWIETKLLTQEELLSEIQRGVQVDGVLLAALFYNDLHS